MPTPPPQYLIEPTTDAGQKLAGTYSILVPFIADIERQAAAAERAAIRTEFHKRLLGLRSLTPDMVRLLLQQILDAREP